MIQFRAMHELKNQIEGNWSSVLQSREQKQNISRLQCYRKFMSNKFVMSFQRQLENSCTSLGHLKNQIRKHLNVNLMLIYSKIFLKTTRFHKFTTITSPKNTLTAINLQSHVNSDKTLWKRTLTSKKLLRLSNHNKQLM